MTIRVAILVAVLVLLAVPGVAHSLRVFVTAEGQLVRGYGFFVGGGRPDGAAWRAEADDVTLATGTTDSAGAFGFVLPGAVAGDIVVTIDPGDGHAARATLTRDRLGGAATARPGPLARGGASVLAGPPPAVTAEQIEAAMDAAVARQVEPLLARIKEMDARLRLADLVSGGLAIFGLAGIGLWLRGRGQ
jgi:nickel transport protein